MITVVMGRAGVLFGLLMGLLAVPQAYADWQLEKDEGGIQIHSRAVKGSKAREVRALSTLNADVIRVVNFLQDPATNARWVPNSKSVSIFERQAQGVTLVHFVMQAGWPFQARDAVARFELVQAPDSTVWIRFESQPERLPPLANTVRLRTYSGCWRLTPLSPQSTHLEYRSHIEAGGRIPAWMANAVAIRSTFTALQNLQQQVPDYVIPANSPLGFLRDAGHNAVLGSAPSPGAVSTAVTSTAAASVGAMNDSDCASAFAWQQEGSP